MNTPTEKKGGWKQSSLDPNGPLVWKQDSLDPQETEETGEQSSHEEDKKKLAPRIGKFLPLLLPVALILAVWLIMRQNPAPDPSPSPADSSASETQDIETDAVPETEAEPESPAEPEEEAAAPAEIIFPDTFGDQLADYTDDRYITNLNHYSQESALIGTIQEAVAVPWEVMNISGYTPAFINHMSENLYYSFDSKGDFPYTDYTFSYDSYSARERAEKDIDYLKSSADSYEELIIGNLTEYSCASGTYLIYEVLKRTESGPSLETYALRDLEGGGCFICALDQFYPSTGTMSVTVTGDEIDDRYPEEFLAVLDALVKYSPEEISSITAVSPWAQQDYYAYDGGKTVFVDAALSDTSLLYYGFDHSFMTDNSMTLRKGEDGTTYSSCARSFMYTVPSNEDGSYTPLPYIVSESIHYEFYRLYEDNFYTNYVTAPHATPTGTISTDVVSFTEDDLTFYARCVKTVDPGENYPQGEDTIYVWMQVSGNTGLIIRDTLKNFGDAPWNDVEEIARRLAGTVKNIY